MKTSAKNLYRNGTAEVRENFEHWQTPLHYWVPKTFGVILLILMWVYIASIFPEGIMPYPIETLEITWSLFSQDIVVPHLLATLWRTVLAFIIELMIGIPIGVLMGTNNYAKNFLLPHVIIGLSLPAVAMAIIGFLIFGFSLSTPVFATVVVTFPFIAINVWEGVENIDHDLMTMSESFRINRTRLFYRMILPSVAPALFASIRFGIAISFRVVTIAELFGTSSGIGYKLIQTFDAYRFEEAWAWALIFITVILVIEYGIFTPIENKVFGYRQEDDLSVLTR